MMVGETDIWWMLDAWNEESHRAWWLLIIHGQRCDLVSVSGVCGYLNVTAERISGRSPRSKMDCWTPPLTLLSCITNRKGAKESLSTHKEVVGPTTLNATNYTNHDDNPPSALLRTRIQRLIGLINAQLPLVSGSFIDQWYDAEGDGHGGVLEYQSQD